MKAIQIDNPGGPDAMHVRDVAIPTATAGTVLVKLAAAGVNYIDVYYRNATYPPPQLPFTPGLEGAGTVTAVGDGVTDFKAGERVAWSSAMGSYAEHALVPVAKLVHVPADIDLTDAAALMLQGMTAEYLSSKTFGLAPGHVALVHAGAGGVGLLLTQLAKARGATVITTVSTDDKAKLSRGAGADHVILYNKDDFQQEVRRITDGKGVHVVYDSVGKTTFEKSLDSLRPLGMMVLFGGSSGPVPPFDLQGLMARGSLFITRPTLFSHTATAADLRALASRVFEAVKTGKLKLRIGGTYPLGEAARAHSDLEARKTTGKLLLRP